MNTYCEPAQNKQSESRMHQLQRAEITVDGDVQAVGYRYAVKRTAMKLKIQGYIQNMPDGTVKIIAEAPKYTIQKFIEAIRIKEPPITVEHVETKYTKPNGEFKFFTVKYGELAEEMAEGFGTGQSYINLSRAENKQGFQMVREEIGGMRKETKQGFQTLGNDIGGVKKEIGGVKKEIGGLRADSQQGFQSLRDETRGGFKDLKTEVRGGFQGLGTETKAMREDMNKNFETMSTKYDAISQNLSEAVKAIQKESAQTRTEMIRAVDNLSKLVQAFIEETKRRRRHED